MGWKFPLDAVATVWENDCDHFITWSLKTRQIGPSSFVCCFVLLLLSMSLLSLACCHHHHCVLSFSSSLSSSLTHRQAHTHTHTLLLFVCHGPISIFNNVWLMTCHLGHVLNGEIKMAT